MLYGLTVSFNPPVSLTIGIVPNLMAIIWLSPQGSYLEGIRNKSLPAYSSFARCGLYPKYTLNLSGYLTVR